MQQVFHEDAHAEDARDPPGGERRRSSDRRRPVRHLPQGVVLQILSQSPQAEHSRHRIPRPRNAAQRPADEGAPADGRHGSLVPPAAERDGSVEQSGKVFGLVHHRMLPVVSKTIQEHQSPQGSPESRPFGYNIRLFRFRLLRLHLLLHLQSAVWRCRGPPSPPDQEPRVSSDGDSAVDNNNNSGGGSSCRAGTDGQLKCAGLRLVVFFAKDVASAVSVLLLRLCHRIAALPVRSRAHSPPGDGSAAADFFGQSAIRHPAKDPVPSVRPAIAAGPVPDSPDGPPVARQLPPHSDASVVGRNWPVSSGRGRR